MKILITGAGMVGCHAARRLLENGHQVVLYDLFPDQKYIQSVVGDAKGLAVEAADLRDLPALLTTLQKYGSDMVVHTAGFIGKKVSERPYTGFTVNVQGSVLVAEAVRILNLKRLVFMSSFAVYNWDIPVKAPYSEDLPLASSNLYVATKIACEHLLGAIADLAGYELIVLRLAGIFGCGQFRGGSKVGTVMNEVVGKAVRKEPVRIKESLLGTSEYVYVKDVAQVIEKACTTTSVKSRAFNIGMGTIHTAQDVVQKVCALIPDARVELVPLEPQEKVSKQVTQPMDLSRSKAELGYEPEYNLDAALADYIKSLRD